MKDAGCRVSCRSEWMGSQVKARTLANLTRWPPERIGALRKALKGDFDGLAGEAVSGKIVGVLLALKPLADQVGITRALGRSEPGRLALFLVRARIETRACMRGM